MARYVLDAFASPRVAILYQNDDLGKDFGAGFRSGLGGNADSLIVSEQTFEVADPGMDDADVKDFLDWEKANLTQGNPRDSGVVVGYIASFLAAHILEKAGSTVTCENVLNVATHLNNLRCQCYFPASR